MEEEEITSSAINRRNETNKRQVHKNMMKTLLGWSKEAKSGPYKSARPWSWYYPSEVPGVVTYGGRNTMRWYSTEGDILTVRQDNYITPQVVKVFDQTQFVAFSEAHMKTNNNQLVQFSFHDDDSELPYGNGLKLADSPRIRKLLTINNKENNINMAEHDGRITKNQARLWWAETRTSLIWQKQVGDPSIAQRRVTCWGVINGDKFCIKACVYYGYAWAVDNPGWKNKIVQEGIRNPTNYPMIPILAPPTEHIANLIIQENNGINQVTYDANIKWRERTYQEWRVGRDGGLRNKRIFKLKYLIKPSPMKRLEGGKVEDHEPIPLPK